MGGQVGVAGSVEVVGGEVAGGRVGVDFRMCGAHVFEHLNIASINLAMLSAMRVP